MVVAVFPGAARADDTSFVGNSLICDEMTTADHPLFYPTLWARILARTADDDGVVPPMPTVSNAEAYRVIGEAFLVAVARDDPDWPHMDNWRAEWDKLLQGGLPANGVALKLYVDRRSGDWEFFKGTENVISGTCPVAATAATPAVPGVNFSPGTIHLRYAQIAALQVRANGNLLLQKAAHARIRDLSNQYENLLTKGMPMWPWEMWANGSRLGTSDAEPPWTTQLVLLHPTGGLSVVATDWRDTRIKAALGLEPIGFVRYLDKTEYDRWWGLSTLIAFPTSRNAGVGGLGRYNTWSLGATWHPAADQRDEEVLLFLGVEIYDLLQEKGAGASGLKGKIKTMLDAYLAKAK
jgi:hypothetical protein